MRCRAEPRRQPQCSAALVPYLLVPNLSSYPQRRHPRLVGYDYRTAGYYFITVCTEHRLPLFGAIEEGAMHLSPGGEMVGDAWRDLLDLHPGIAIDVDVVLPDHIHAIV